MYWLPRLFIHTCSIAVLSLTLIACGGGGGGGDGGSGGGSTSAPPVPPPPPPLGEAEAARFLSQTTFGPNGSDIAKVVNSSMESWFLNELDKPATLHLQDVLDRFPPDGVFYDERGMPLPEILFTASDSFWEKAIAGDDQLRQRMAFALSQILVVSSQSNLNRVPQTVAAYMDVLTSGAFGNFRDLLEEVTYSPAMAIYLTYLRNEKADPETGRVPDENYAREVLQLFTVGLIALNNDGSPTLNEAGDTVELFDNDDITGLAKVFTGLSFAGAGFRTPLRLLPLESYYQPLQVFDAFHSSEPKQFLGTTIAADTNGVDSIDQALDAIFAHPNVGPFLSRQLIQRFVTSHPSAQYVERVTAAFNSGSYTLPSGTGVGSGQRGDLAATLAAIFFDTQARDSDVAAQEGFGKLREPVIRFTHWARAFKINNADASNQLGLRDTSSSERLGQHPYRSTSVFNFYRPGYVAPGTLTGDAALTVPELQIVNATTIMGYPNFMTAFALGFAAVADANAPSSYVPDYSAELALASDIDALLDHLDVKLTHGSLRPETRARITQALEIISPDSDEGLLNRARLGSVMVMTAPEYIVLR